MNKRKIRLFVDAHIFDGIQQGSVTYIAGIYSELLKDNRFQIYIGAKNISAIRKYICGNNFIHIKYRSDSKVKRLLFSIPKAIKKYKIDYAHFQYITPPIKKCKYIITIHDLLFLDFPKKFPLKYRIKNFILFYLSAIRSDLIFTVSEYSKQSIIKHFKIASNKIEISPNAVDISTGTGKTINSLKNKKFILFVSRIEPRKNQSLLIQIWKEMKLYDQGYNLVLVGSKGIKDEKFENQIKNLTKIEKKHFYWLTNVPIQKLNWLYINCSLFIYPSLCEGFGIPPLEAALHGAKVLLSNTTAMSEFTFFGDYLVSPKKEEIINKINWALSSEFPHQKIIKEIKARYNWVIISRNFANKIIDSTNEK